MRADTRAAVLEACARGVLPPSLTAMQLILARAERGSLLDEAVLARLDTGDRAAGRRRLQRAQRLIVGRSGAVRRVRTVAAAVPHAPGTAEQDWARHFDAAVRISPEASVALYSLGDPALLRAATREIVACLRSWRLLDRNRRVLDVGCGIGRLCAALAPHVRTVIGVDVSAGMLEAARRRCARHAGVHLMRGSATRLSELPARSVDLVLAVDCLPYVQLSDPAGASRFLSQAVRVLRPGGDLVAFNWSYRHVPGADEEEFERLAGAAGLAVLCRGTRPLKSWDGRAFHARVAAAAVRSSRRRRRLRR